MDNPVARMVEDSEQLRALERRVTGPVANIASTYSAETSDRLLGFLLSLTYDEVQILTCDQWKQKCGGVPRNSFVMVKLSPRAVTGIDPRLASRLILARVTEPVPTPVERDIQQTIFEVHKVQAVLDPLTNQELQWGALKASILGTYYDTEDGKIEFGNDVDTFLSPHFYEVYVPMDEHLATLLNSFVRTPNALRIGDLRYTETPPLGKGPNVPIYVNPDDFIGFESGHRTALFGKTRTGKSNTIKVIADAILRSGRSVSQIIFDASGEYTYVNQQDGTSIYALHRDRCTRYSFRPRLPDVEREKGFPEPKLLRANFFKNVELGHTIIRVLFDTHFPRRPNYMVPVLEWDPVDPDRVNERFADEGDRKRYRRTLGMYYAVLIRSGFDPPKGLFLEVPLREGVKKELAKDPSVQSVARRETRHKNGQYIEIISETQPIEAIPPIYEALYTLWRANSNNEEWFPKSPRTGEPYFDLTQDSLLRMLGDRNISGPTYFRPFRQYHDVAGRDVAEEILDDVVSGNTVLVDYANANEEIVRFFSELICKRVFGWYMDQFAENRLGDKFVVFYFEEAHNLFRADDKDLTSIYNRLAKEGAKFHIGMVYATQSMTTLSPDLLKNTENFFIAHLSDDREIREVTRRYEFRDVAEDVQRVRSRGYVRMITLSHRFVLPVQIVKFGSGLPGEGPDGVRQGFVAS